MEVSDENELDRLLFFEEARKISEANYASDPHDADNLTRWAGALLELSQCQSPQDSLKMIKGSSNEIYLKSLQISSKAPELHREILKQGLDQQMVGVVPSTAASSSSEKPGKKGKKNNDLRYDIFGWIALVIGIIVWVGFVKSQPLTTIG
ncbi:hypothetical protein V6N13_024071 [Hibiscus sabdariffa]|uniref:Uncharacterized protein n=1 Tax=Hibiscus sabdariffa TaxID=183260 RepID=A0ABR2BWX2_9ROSI